MIEIEPFGEVDEQGLREIEQALGAQLPAAYREFLARTGGGWAKKPNYLVGPTTLAPRRRRGAILYRRNTLSGRLTPDLPT